MGMPSVGSLWRNTETDRFTRVSHVNRTRVLLMGDMGTVSIPLYEWPGPYVPASEDSGVQEDVRALLVGGSTGRHFARIWEQAAELGVDIEYHWPGGVHSLPKNLPGDVGLVIALVSHVGHSEYAFAKELAKGGRVPFARVPSGGFKQSLQSELEKLGFESFGAIQWETGPHGESFQVVPRLRRESSATVYVWTGVDYELQTVATSSQLPSPSQGASMLEKANRSDLGVFAMALLSGLGLWKTS